MPNWCDNTVVITGKKENLDELIDSTKLYFEDLVDGYLEEEDLVHIKDLDSAKGTDSRSKCSGSLDVF